MKVVSKKAGNSLAAGTGTTVGIRHGDEISARGEHVDTIGRISGTPQVEISTGSDTKLCRLSILANIVRAGNETIR